MKILVIGGTRFLGYHITKRLLEGGHEVFLFNRGRTPDDFGDSVERIIGNRWNTENFHNKLKGKSFDAVVDMIAFKEEDSRSAVEVFLGNVGHFIHISTAAVYVITKDYPCPIREADYRRELNPKSETPDELWIYAFNKRKCEDFLHEAFQEHLFPVTIIRPPIIIGERDYTLRAYSYFLRILDGNPLILPDGGVNVVTHVYQDDLVRTITDNLLNRSCFGQSYHLAQEEILSTRQFVLQAAEILEKEVEFIDVPSKVLEKASLGKSFSPFSWRRPFVLDVHKARQKLRFSSTPFKLWMKKTIDWFVEEYRGKPPENYKERKREIEFIQEYRRALDTLKTF